MASLYWRSTAAGSRPRDGTLDPIRYRPRPDRLGGADVQLHPHAVGNLKVGNTAERQIAAMIHCLPYIGFPRALNAIRAITEAAASEASE